MVKNHNIEIITSGNFGFVRFNLLFVFCTQVPPPPPMSMMLRAYGSCLKLMHKNSIEFRNFISLIKVISYVSGDIYVLFGGTDYLFEDESVSYRVKRFAYACIQAVYENRYFLGLLVLEFCYN